jgi:hypothetical protein
MKPIVGLALRVDDELEAEIFYTIRRFGINVLRFDYNSASRWDTMCNVAWVRKRVVCVIDEDPEMVRHATALGFHAVVWTTPENTGFSWHLRADSVPDLSQGVAYRLKEWRDKHRDDLRAVR